MADPAPASDLPTLKEYGATRRQVLRAVGGSVAVILAGAVSIASAKGLRHLFRAATVSGDIGPAPQNSGPSSVNQVNTNFDLSKLGEAGS